VTLNDAPASDDETGRIEVEIGDRARGLPHEHPLITTRGSSHVTQAFDRMHALTLTGRSCVGHKAAR
jgi:hypothetical protein